MLKYIILGLSIPIVAFFLMYRWEKLKNKGKNYVFSTGIAILIIGIFLLIALLMD